MSGHCTGFGPCAPCGAHVGTVRSRCAAAVTRAAWGRDTGQLRLRSAGPAGHQHRAALQGCLAHGPVDVGAGYPLGMVVVSSEVPAGSVATVPPHRCTNCSPANVAAECDLGASGSCSVIGAASDHQGALAVERFIDDEVTMTFD